MVRAGMCVAARAFAVAVWIGVAHFVPTAAEAAPPADAKGVDLTALRDAVDSAAAKGENVDEIRKALDAFAKTAPKANAGRVAPELQALRDAVDAAAKKGENVDGILKELVAVETAVAGRALTAPKPEPRPNPDPIGRVPRPIAPDVPFPILPNPGFPGVNPGGFGGVGGGIDVEAFNKAMELRRKAVELMLKNPNDPDAIKEAQKLQQEAADLMLKILGGAGGLGGLGGAGGLGGIGMPAPLFPDVGRVPDRARFGIRLERVPALVSEQLGLEPNTGIAVTMVVGGSVAEKAGVKVHDIIVEFGGKAVTDNTDEFINRVNAIKAGEKVDIVLLRKGKKVELKGVELPEAKPFRVPLQPVPGVRPNVPNAVNPFGRAADALDPVKPVFPPPVQNLLPLMP